MFSSLPKLFLHQFYVTLIDVLIMKRKKKNFLKESILCQSKKCPSSRSLIFSKSTYTFKIPLLLCLLGHFSPHLLVTFFSQIVSSLKLASGLLDIVLLAPRTEQAQRRLSCGKASPGLSLCTHCYLFP